MGGRTAFAIIWRSGSQNHEIGTDVMGGNGGGGRALGNRGIPPRFRDFRAAADFFLAYLGSGPAKKVGEGRR